ncbi:hypothetical protein EW026_g1437 [Hermanssonia centrifuga]|uniref:FAD-binding domain-containing protein n=1 Tax=Hermanssonia centrifuga TaxID=98765 RepID=A0A4S4KRD7_9APHY|nr:hypothetical protein EW026_g1437 [Hermanssonia centrifuga]
MTSIKDLRVAIVGGGVCGLTCAIALAKKGIRAHIYEAAAEFGEIGAAIGIGPTAVRVLHDLDLLKDVLTKADASDPNAEVSWFQFRSGLDDHEIIYEYALKPGEQSIGMHRAAFLDALVDHVDPQLTHFNKRCINVTPSTTDSSRLTLYFADGNNDEADIVLGADGIKSAVRAAVAGADLGKTLKFSNNE